jgi:excisionase family DNA binding protein
VLTVQEAAELLSVCKNTIYKLVKEQELPSRRIGTTIRIRKKDVLAYIAGTNMN